MGEHLENLLAEYTLFLADDELILGHRNSEWCGHAPILEEDIAFANIALDELGHAILWYQVHAEIKGMDVDTYPDEVVYFRDYKEFRNIRLVAMPNSDWAFTMLRQYFFDLYERINLDYLVNGQYGRFVEIAEKIKREEVYHLRHSQTWVRRLGLGTEESNKRLQKALDVIWPLTQQMFSQPEEATQLIDAGFIPNPAETWPAWLETVIPFLKNSALVVPENGFPNLSRFTQPDDFYQLICELQEVARQYPNVSW